MKKYTGNKEKCPYCDSKEVRFRGIMTDRVSADPRTYEVLALWQCKKCGDAFRELIEW